MGGPESQNSSAVYGTKGALAGNLETMNGRRFYGRTDDPSSGYTTIYGGDRFPFHGAFVPGQANAIGFEDLVAIEDHRVALRKAPEVPWLARLYPELDSFCLPLPELLGLNGSWQWYERGLRYPGLEAPLHPYHGVYFSPRPTHVELFAAWLAEQPSPAPNAVDRQACQPGLLSLVIGLEAFNLQDQVLLRRRWRCIVRLFLCRT